MKIQVLTICCAVGLALTLSVQDSTAARFKKYTAAADTPANSDTTQNGDYLRIEQEISAISQTLARVDSLRSADTAAKEIKPRVKFLDEQFDHDFARKSLSKEQYNRLVRNIHAVYTQITNLSEVERSFYGSVNLAKVGNKFKYIVREVTHPKKS